MTIKKPTPPRGYDSEPFCQDKNAGYGTRYDNIGGNNIDIERRKHQALGFHGRRGVKTCRSCKQLVPVKGGTNKNRVFICAECNEKRGLT